MQALLLNIEQACKGVVDSLATGVPCYRGLSNDYDTETNCVVVEADATAEEAKPGTGVYIVPVKVSVLETAIEGDESVTTLSKAVFGAFETENIKTILANSGSNLFVYGVVEPSFSNAVIGDTWVQTLNFKVHGCLTD